MAATEAEAEVEAATMPTNIARVRLILWLSKRIQWPLLCRPVFTLYLAAFV